LATSGEAGIEGMSPEECGPLREQEQQRAAAHVGVEVVDFLGFPDSRLRNDETLRDAVAKESDARRPDVGITRYTGPNYTAEIPSQSDHSECRNAGPDAVASPAHHPRRV